MNQNMIRRARLVLAGAALMVGGLAAAPARADQIGDMLKLATDKLAPAIVDIRAVNTATETARGQTQDHDIVLTLKGVVVSPSGLVMCTNGYFSGDRLKQAMGLSLDQTQFDLKMTSKEIRVTVGNEPTEYYGTLAAQDSTIGLAFIQIRDLKGRTLPFVDFTAATSATPAVGELTASATRLGKGNDYAPIAIEDRIAGMITKPRRAYVPEGYAGGMGLPVYISDGSLLGVVTSLPSAADPNDQGTEVIARLLNDELTSFHSQFIVPAANVAPLIAAAKTRAADLPPFVVPVPKPITPPKPTGTAPAPAKPAPSAPSAPSGH